MALRPVETWSRCTVSRKIRLRRYPAAEVDLFRIRPDQCWPVRRRQGRGDVPRRVVRVKSQQAGELKRIPIVIHSQDDTLPYAYTYTYDRSLLLLFRRDGGIGSRHARGSLSDVGLSVNDAYALVLHWSWSAIRSTEQATRHTGLPELDHGRQPERGSGEHPLDLREYQRGHGYTRCPGHTASPNGTWCFEVAQAMYAASPTCCKRQLDASWLSAWHIP